MDHPLIRRRGVEAMTGLSRATLYRAIAAGRFPPPVRLTARCVAWRRSDVEAWIVSLKPASMPE